MNRRYKAWRYKTPNNKPFTMQKKYSNNEKIKDNIANEGNIGDRIKVKSESFYFPSGLIELLDESF